MTLAQPPRPTAGSASTDPALVRVAKLTAEIGQLAYERELAIHYATRDGASWAEIGRALGVTAQAAHKNYRWLRYSPTTHEIWREPPLPQ